MKKKISGAIFMVVLTAIAGYNIYLSQAKSEMSELALANMEALADSEGSGSDCQVYCTSDDNYTCIITYQGDVEGITCPDMRKK